MKLHYNIGDHWNESHQLIHQNLAIDIASQGGDLLETTALHLMVSEDMKYEIIRGIVKMSAGVDNEIIPRVKSFDDTVPKLEPDRWAEVNGIWYRVKDVSDSQGYMIWAVLNRLGVIQPAMGFGRTIINNGYKLKWDGKTTKNGNFLPFFWDSSHLRAMHLAKFYAERPPISVQLAFRFIELWSTLWKWIRKYGPTDWWNTCFVLYMMGEKEELKFHLNKYRSWHQYFEDKYKTNHKDAPDSIQDDCKFIILGDMISYVMA